MDDMEWLREYASQKSEEAFERVVRRHINFVYSAALRQMWDPHRAEEVTQAAFIILAQKAASVRPDTVLSGWLFNTVRFIAATEFRSAARRRRYEQEAYMESLTQGGGDEAIWQHLVPHLDKCLAELGDKDRQAVLLRFFEQKSFLEVGLALGTNEDAATKRARRAVEKLRLSFMKRGVVLSTAAIAGLLSAHGVQAAPAALASSVNALAVVHGATATSSTATLIKGTLKLMAWTKLKTAAIGAGILLVAGLTTVTVTQVHQRGDNGRIKYLPDGSFVRLLETSYVTNFNYRVPQPQPWQRKLAEHLPSSLASRYPWWLGNSASMGLNSPEGGTNLVVVTASERASSVTSRSGLAPELTLVAFDDQGDESFAAFGASTIGNDDGKRFRSIKGWMVSAFPRRSESLGLRFLHKLPGTNIWQTALEFHIPNPAFQNYPTWTAEPLPVTKADGDLSVTLTGLTAGEKLSAKDDQPMAELGELPGVTAVFKTEASGQSGPVWSPKSVQSFRRHRKQMDALRSAHIREARGRRG